jgi:hypothetical protein
MDAGSDRAREYADERARNLVRNYGKTRLRVLILYIGGLFFTLITIAQAINRPTRLGSYDGLIFVAVCIIAIVMLRMRIRRGWELLVEEGEVDNPDSADPQS